MFFNVSSWMTLGEHVPRMFSTQRIKADVKTAWKTQWMAGAFETTRSGEKLRSDTNSNAISKQYEAESRSALKHRHTLLGDRIASQSREEIRSHTLTLHCKSKHEHSI
jgi:beta-glucosidase-like glycosyl hydrolase